MSVAEKFDDEPTDDELIDIKNQEVQRVIRSLFDKFEEMELVAMLDLWRERDWRSLLITPPHAGVALDREEVWQIIDALGEVLL